jgi:predicted nucleic acid-binding protein
LTIRTIDTRFFLTHFTADTIELKSQTRKKMHELEAESAILPTIVLHELYKIQCETVGKDTAEIRTNLILNSNFTVVDFGVEISRVAGRVRCQIPKLPTADGIIAATAITTKSLRVVTDDPHFDLVKEIKTEWL